MNTEKIINFIKSMYQTDPKPNSQPPNTIIPLHEPVFMGNEKKYLNECIDSTFVSSVGKFVDRFEDMLAEYTSAKYAIATVNGTSALHIALLLAGVEPGTEVVTQPLTFVATCNAIKYCGAEPVFVDVDKETLGMSPDSLRRFLHERTEMRNGVCINLETGNKVVAVVPMHTFGHPCRIDEILDICQQYNINLVEDAAESLGSFYKGKHTGTFGVISAFSFNGNKTITTGGGGMIITDNAEMAKRAKHITTTAKVPHHPTSNTKDIAPVSRLLPSSPWDYVHDCIGFNYRLPNLNAALGCAQMEKLDEIIENKRGTAEAYRQHFADIPEVNFIIEPAFSKSNYWLNALLFSEPSEAARFLEKSNAGGVMTRPVWRLMNQLEMFETCECMPVENAEWLVDRLVNLPSGVIPQL